MRIRDLGQLDGDILLLGGVYSNFQALTALMSEGDRRAIPPAHRICTGDVVAYCGEPGACVERMKSGAYPVLRGNCEIQLAEGQPDCGCGFVEGSLCATLSRDWYSFAQQSLGEDARRWMAELPDLLVFTAHGARYAVIHGGVSDVSRFLWPTDPDRVFEEELDHIARAVGSVDGVISGHCGMAFERKISGVHWINAGVIGMPPHDGHRSTAFAVLTKNGVDFQRLTYDTATAADMMARAGLGPDYRESLQTGFWPSEDILPPELRQLPASG